ncbi:MAG: hypothetical protein ABRQ26_08040 [Syntrophomonadaceae bacterium]
MRKCLLFSLFLVLALGILGGVFYYRENENDQLQERRIQLLEDALAPKTADGVAYSWAQAVKTRNGAWQYALMNDILRRQYLKEFEETNWVTGFSSPWVEKYKVSRQSVDEKGSVNFQINFDWYTSSGYAYSNTAILVATRYDPGQVNERWLISFLDFEYEPAP